MKEKRQIIFKKYQYYIHYIAEIHFHKCKFWYILQGFIFKIANIALLMFNVLMKEKRQIIFKKYQYYIHYIAPFVPRISWSLYCQFEWWGDVKAGGGGWFIYYLFNDLGGGVTGGGYHIFPIFCTVFVLLLIILSWLVHDSLLCLFHCSFFAFFVSASFN